MKYLKNFIFKAQNKDPETFINKFDASIELLPMAIAIMDVNGDVEYVNRKFCLLTEYSNDEIIGQNLDFLKSGNNDDSFYEQIFHTIKSGKEWRGVFSSKKKRGELFWCNTTITPILDKTEIVHFIVIKEDITIIVEQEKKIRNLKGIITYHRNMGALGEVISIVSHEFNNILNGIINLADLLKITQKNLNENSLKYVDLILSSATKATDLTKKLSRAKRSVKIKYLLFDLSQFLKNYVNNLNKAISNNCDIQFKTDLKSLNIMGNRAQITDSLDNLVHNALQSMGNSGEMKISLDKIELDGHDNHVIPYIPGEFFSITIHDNGCGIKTEYISRIFDPFYSSDMNRSGLGLSTVLNCLKEHSGTIFVDSQENVGSKFSICFPSDKNRADNHSFSRDIVILFVDDEKINRETGSELIEYLGYKVKVASNATEALDIYKKQYNSIDLVLLDMVMPDMNGFETYIAMKKINSSCKGIIATGYTEFIKIQELLDNGISAILKKPYSIEELRQVITDNI